MDNDLYKYYEHELSYFREIGIEFGKKYNNAKYLQLERGDDPHTERLIEAFAFIAAQIHNKIDDDFPAIIQSLINNIFPNFNLPVPSMAMISFKPSNNVPDEGYEIEKGTPINSIPIELNNGKTICTFQTVYPVKLWPLDIVKASIIPDNSKLKGEKIISIYIESLSKKDLSSVSLDELIFFINPKVKDAYELYELIINHVFTVDCMLFDDDQQSVMLENVVIQKNIEPFGFDKNDHLMQFQDKGSYEKNIFPGYLLLYDYFCFKEKYLFFKIKGLEKLNTEKKFCSFLLFLHLNKSPSASLQMKKDTFSLYTTPIINLFEHQAEPIQLKQQKNEYPVIPCKRQPDSLEVFKILSISSSQSIESEKRINYFPMYGRPLHIYEYDHSSKNYYWQHQRRKTVAKNIVKTELFLSFTNEDLIEKDPDGDTLTIKTICTNGNLPDYLTFDHIDNNSIKTHFEHQLSGAPVKKQIFCIVKPTSNFTPFTDEKLQWQLISHLSQNFFSIISKNVDILKEMLSLYDFRDLPSNKKQINGILNITSESVTRRIKQSSFCRGTHVTIEFDKNKYTDSSLLLFASVLERFLGYLAPINSFIQVTAKIKNNDEILKKWTPRNEHMSL